MYLSVQEREKKVAELEQAMKSRAKTTQKRKSPPKHTVTTSRNCNLISVSSIGNSVSKVYNTVRKSIGLSDVTVTDTGDDCFTTAQDKEAAYNRSLGMF